jgi:uncharacterized membrane protein
VDSGVVVVVIFVLFAGMVAWIVRPRNRRKSRRDRADTLRDVIRERRAVIVRQARIGMV